MKKLIGLFLVTFLALTAPVFAANCPQGQRMTKIGSVAIGANGTAGNGDMIISGQGWDVAMIEITCSSTACIATLYDGTAFATDAINANVVFEPTAAASTATVYDFTSGSSAGYPTGIRFKNGILFHGDANTKAVLCYACQ